MAKEISENEYKLMLVAKDTVDDLRQYLQKLMEGKQACMEEDDFIGAQDLQIDIDEVAAITDRLRLTLKGRI